MRELPTSDYPDKTEGVTLKCTRAYEAVCALHSNAYSPESIFMLFASTSDCETAIKACYRDHTNTGRVRGYTYLAALCSAYPVHILYGAVDDYMYVPPSSCLSCLCTDVRRTS